MLKEERRLRAACRYYIGDNFDLGCLRDLLSYVTAFRKAVEEAQKEKDAKLLDDEREYGAASTLRGKR